MIRELLYLVRIWHIDKKITQYDVIKNNLNIYNNSAGMQVVKREQPSSRKPCFVCARNLRMEREYNLLLLSWVIIAIQLQLFSRRCTETCLKWKCRNAILMNYMWKSYLLHYSLSSLLLQKVAYVSIKACL